MATPIGHCLIGASIGVVCSRERDTYRSAAVGALAAIAADFDFIPGLLLGELGRFHHAQSHSLTFAILAAILALLLAKEGHLRWGLLVGLGYTSHLVLDFFTFDDSPPQGIPLLWPWSAEVFLSPRTLLPNVVHGGGMVLSMHNAGIVMREVGLFGPLLAGSLFYAKRRRHSVQEQLT